MEKGRESYFLECLIGWVLKGKTSKTRVFLSDDVEKFTSKVHDPYARSRYLQKRAKQEHPTGGTGVGPAKHPPKVKSEIFLQL